MPTYRTVIEVDLDAEHEMAAARAAVNHLRGIQNPTVFVHDVATGEGVVWQQVDLEVDGITAAPPTCLQLNP